MAAEEGAHDIVVGPEAGNTQAANHRVGVIGDTREEAPGVAKRNSLFFFFSPEGEISEVSCCSVQESRPGCSLVEFQRASDFYML